MSEVVNEKIVLDTKEKLRSVILDLNYNYDGFNDKYDYSSITDMSFMFKGCENLKTIPYLNTSNVVNMESMFEDCISLTDISTFDDNVLKISNVSNMKNMFKNCHSFEDFPFDVHSFCIKNAFDKEFIYQGFKSFSGEKITYLFFLFNLSFYKLMKNLMKIMTIPLILFFIFVVFQNYQIQVPNLHYNLTDLIDNLIPITFISHLSYLVFSMLSHIKKI